jgi:hypothetical protein
VQNLLSDVHPDFTTSEQRFVAEFNGEANGYELRQGPLCNRHAHSDPQAYRSGRVPLVEISQEDLHPDVRFFATEEDFGEFEDNLCDETGANECYLDKFELMALRYGVPDEEPPEEPLTGNDLPRREDTSDNSVDEFRGFNQFPGALGSHKAIEVTVKKWCVTKRFTRLCESHGKRGRR